MERVENVVDKIKTFLDYASYLLLKTIIHVKDVKLGEKRGILLSSNHSLFQLSSSLILSVFLTNRGETILIKEIL